MHMSLISAWNAHPLGSFWACRGEGPVVPLNLEISKNDGVSIALETLLTSRNLSISSSILQFFVPIAAAGLNSFLMIARAINPSVSVF